MAKWNAFEFMTRDVYCARPEMTLRELTRELVLHKVTGAPVVDEEKRLVGVVSLTDVAVDATQQADASARTVQEIMQRHVISVSVGAGLTTVVDLFKTHRVHRLIVTHDDRVCGVLSPLDLLDAILERVGYPQAF